jgi:hypothetical protein
MSKIAILALVVTLAGGCTTIEQDAARRCGRNYECQQQYLAREQARIDNENAMLGAIIVGNGFRHQSPIFVGCTTNALAVSCIAQ